MGEALVCCTPDAGPWWDVGGPDQCGLAACFKPLQPSRGCLRLLAASPAASMLSWGMRQAREVLPTGWQGHHSALPYRARHSGTPPRRAGPMLVPLLQAK